MYSQAQRFVATVLLFCILLQSCGTNPFNLDQAQRQAIEAQVDQQRQAPKQPRPKRRPQAPSSTEERAAPRAEARAPDKDTPTNSLAQQPSSPGSGLESSPKGDAKQPRQAAPIPSHQAQRISGQPGQGKDHPKALPASQVQAKPSKEPVVVPAKQPERGWQAPKEDVAPALSLAATPLSFTASEGQRVVFSQEKDGQGGPQ